jgi:hypothetical protein
MCEVATQIKPQINSLSTLFFSPHKYLVGSAPLLCHSFCLFVCLFVLFFGFSKQGFSVKPWLSWNSLCSLSPSSFKQINWLLQLRLKKKKKKKNNLIWILTGTAGIYRLIWEEISFITDNFKPYLCT